MNDLDLLLKQLLKTPKTVEFDNVIDAIDTYYHYTPTSFTNGPTDDKGDGLTDEQTGEKTAEYVTNNAGENEGSCKIFSFAQIHQLDEMQTLHCFGQYYREDVVKNPERNDHANIRYFMKYGWAHISFEATALRCL